MIEIVAALTAGVVIGAASVWRSQRKMLEDLDRRFPALYQDPQGEPSDLCQRLESRLLQARVLRERYDTLLNNLAASIVIRDRNGELTYASPFTESLTGYNIDEIYDWSGDFFSSITHPEDRPILEKALGIVNCGESFQYRLRLAHKTGIEVWSETRSVPVFAPDGGLAFSLSVSIDVTSTVRAEKKVEEKNRDLGEFTYMLTHDLKAPIVTIKGMIGVIEEEVTGQISDDGKSCLLHVEQATKRLEQLVSSILEYSRVSNIESHLAPVALNDVIDEVNRDLAPQFAELGVQVKLPAELPSVVGDKLRLYQIFSNLFSNAIKYRSKERKLELSLSAAKNLDHQSVTVIVADNGVGIAPEMQETVFRPFQRAHADYAPGLGIGLATVRKLVEKMGGKVTLESKPNFGSKFILEFKLGSN